MRKQLTRVKEFCLYMAITFLLIALLKTFTYMSFIPILLVAGLVMFFLGISISVFRERAR
ncbi:MAG: hypothetical protein ACRCWG_06110 [Sarcina sp.]